MHSRRNVLYRFCIRSRRERNISYPGRINYVDYVEKAKGRRWRCDATLQQCRTQNSELYRFNPGNVGNQAPIERAKSEGKDDETHSEECISINDVRKGGDSSSGIGDNSESRIPTEDDIAIRAQSGIAAVFPTTYDSLMMCPSRNTSRPPM